MFWYASEESLQFGVIGIGYAQRWICHHLFNPLYRDLTFFHHLNCMSSVF